MKPLQNLVLYVEFCSVRASDAATVYARRHRRRRRSPAAVIGPWWPPWAGTRSRRPRGSTAGAAPRSPPASRGTSRTLKRSVL